MSNSNFGKEDQKATEGDVTASPSPQSTQVSPSPVLLKYHTRVEDATSMLMIQVAMLDKHALMCQEEHDVEVARARLAFACYMRQMAEARNLVRRDHGDTRRIKPTAAQLKRSHKKQLLEGSFNPYGNGQLAAYTVRPHTSFSFSLGTDDEVVLSALPDPGDKVSRLRLSSWNSPTAQQAPVPPGATLIGWTCIYLARAATPALYTVFGGGPVLKTDSEYVVLGFKQNTAPFTTLIVEQLEAQTNNLHDVACPTGTGDVELRVSTGKQASPSNMNIPAASGPGTFFSLGLVKPDTVSDIGGGGGATQNVNIVGFIKQDQPIWVTDYTPKADVITPTPAAFNGVRAVEALAANRKMHSLHGNTTTYSNPMEAAYWESMMSSSSKIEEKKSEKKIKMFGYELTNQQVADAADLSTHKYCSLQAAADIIVARSDNHDPALLLAERLELDQADLFLSTVCGRPENHNRWTPLVWQDAELLRGQLEQGQNMKGGTATGIMAGQRQGAAPKAPQAPKSGETKAVDQSKAFDRVVAKLRDATPPQIQDYVTQLPRNARTSAWLASVFGALWGEKWWVKDWVGAWFAWEVDVVDVSNEKVTYGPAIKVAVPRRAVRGWELCQYSGKIDLKLYSRWFKEEFSYECDVAVLKAEADAHNQRMHATNGNPTFSGDMNDVKALPSRIPLYSAANSRQYAEPWVVAAQLSQLESSANPVDMDIPTSSPFRGDVVTAANLVLLGQQLGPQESALYPREVRNGPGGVVIPTTRRLPALICGVMGYQGSVLDDTALMMTIVEAAIKANQTLGRADNTTLGGFNAFDVAYVGRLKSFIGISMQTALTKILALAHCVAWNQPRARLPLSCEAGIFDPYTQVDPAAGLTVGYNNSPVFGENCGGATSVLPWRGGETGNVYFHLTLQTVPEANRATAVFLPANLILSDVDPGLAIFLFVMMWADWPTLMWSVVLPTLNDAAGDLDGQLYVPHLSSLFIPGLVELHVILPRRTTVANPGNQANANSYALVQPTTGTLASTAFPIPATPLDINFVGGPVTGYNLAEYSYTWAASLDLTSVTQFLQRLNDVIAIGDEVRHVYSILTMLGVRYGMMVSQAIAASVKLPVNSAAGGAGFTPNGIRALPTLADWPQTVVPRPDFLLFETDIIAWNKTVLTVSLPDGRLGSGLAMTPWLGNPSSLFWLKNLARTYAAVNAVHVSGVGWSGATWDQAYANADMQSFRTLARAHYATALASGVTPAPARMGKPLAGLFTSCIGAGCTEDLAGNTVWDYWTPPRGSRTCICTAAGVELTNTVPILLPDVWIQQTCVSLPRFAASFPPQNNKESATGLVTSESTTVILGGGTLYGPMMAKDYQRNALRQTDTRDDSDDDIWTMRLSYAVTATMIMRDMAGNVVPSSPVAGAAPKTAIIVDDYTTPVNGTGIRSASSLWIPRVLADGRIQIPAAPRADMIQTNRIATGIARAAIEIWAVNGILGSGDMKLGIDGPGKSVYWAMISTGSRSQGGEQPVEGLGASTGLADVTSSI